MAMNKHRASRSRIPNFAIEFYHENRWLVFLFAAVLCSPSLGYFLGIRSGRKTFPLFFEIVLLVLLLALLFSSPPMRNYLQQLRTRHRTQFYGLLGAILIAQGISSSRTTFPIMPWTMYAGLNQAPDFVLVYEYFIVTAKGEKLKINPSRLFPSNGRGYRRMSNKLIHTCRAYVKASREGVEHTEAKETLKDLMRALGSQFQKKHPEHEVKSVQIDHYRVPWKEADTLVKEDRARLLEISI
jgi:hypothetical protein